jgi:hypothetical protein
VIPSILQKELTFKRTFTAIRKICRLNRIDWLAAASPPELGFTAKTRTCRLASSYAILTRGSGTAWVLNAKVERHIGIVVMHNYQYSRRRGLHALSELDQAGQIIEMWINDGPAIHSQHSRVRPIREPEYVAWVSSRGFL